MTTPTGQATHQVGNQVPPLAGHDVAADQALLAAVTREGAAWAVPGLHELGVAAGSAQAQDQARLANEHPPVLRTHDRYGHRIDEVEFHPAWHQLMTIAVSHGLHAAPWADARPGAHVARAAGFYVWTQAEAGHGCPVSMTYAVVPALRREPALADRFEPLLTATAYDPGLRAPAAKAGLLAGMAMTEKQGGSDVTGRTPPGPCPPAMAYLLTGHKWFCSAPMSRPVPGPGPGPGAACPASCCPGCCPTAPGTRCYLQRLKDKLGNRSNASAEVEFDGAFGWRVGEPGRGVATIIEMVSATRLDCVLGSAAAMRQACVARRRTTRRTARRSAAP